MIGTVVAGYSVQRKLGEGGVGEVYNALDLMLGREVAIKIVRPEFARDPYVVERFRVEARTLAALSHPNIAMIHALLRDGDMLLMVMELIAGPSLEQILRAGGPADPREAVALVSQAAHGLSYAHAHGVIHRDIKPANLMLDQSGTLKITDFGIARMLHGGRLTRQGHIIGTVAYMAPEQIRGQDADARSDIYALGIVLYELLTGRAPFESDSEYEVMTAQVERAPPPLRSCRPDLSPGLEAVVLKALQKRPEDRFQHPEELLGALATLRLLPGHAGAGPAPTRIGPAGPPWLMPADGPKDTGEPGTVRHAAGKRRRHPPHRFRPAVVAFGVATPVLAGLAAGVVMAVLPARETGHRMATQPEHRPPPQYAVAAGREAPPPPARGAPAVAGENSDVASVQSLPPTMSRPADPPAAAGMSLPVLATSQPPVLPIPNTRAVPGSVIPGTPPEIDQPPSLKSSPRPTEAARPLRSEGQMVTTTGANVRAAPEGAAPVIREVPAGARLQVHARMGGWLQVGDAQIPWGWIHGSRVAGTPAANPRAGTAPPLGESWRIDRAP
jgi:serine/threonine-protein kinase